MKIKKTTLYLALTLIVIVIAGFFFLNSDSNENNISGNVVEARASGNGDVNEITLSMKNYNYYPQTIKVKAGETTRIYLDSSVYGCFRSFTIRDLGVSEYLGTPNEYAEFTPNKKGTYRFACSMGMGTGTLIVE